MLDEVRSDTPPHFAVVALRSSRVFLCAYVFVRSGWGPANTASSGMVLVNPFVSSFGGEAQ
ncbi:hypothetical protein T07_5959 [Trichinella nelsoni]|uniref:Uncharacterized protein n=1 Tax=Trichinella nelsoni TaxID=6336 RepID=A0A0V0RCD8_9BILA|nr:hypothetical protein T07_5959 [Trichinella nelsoni]